MGAVAMASVYQTQEQRQGGGTGQNRPLHTVLVRGGWEPRGRPREEPGAWDFCRRQPQWICRATGGGGKLVWV